MLRFKKAIIQSKRSIYLSKAIPSQQPKQVQLIQTQKQNFALFSQAQDPHEYSQGQRQQEQVDPEESARRLQKIKQSIEDKTFQGRELSQQISKEVDPDKYIKLQRYEIFINKMYELYRNELKFKRRQKKKFQQMQNAHVYSNTPLKDILRHYNDLAYRGFNSELVKGTLEYLHKGIKGRGEKGRVMQDYELREMDQSWRMQKLADDIKFGLQGNQFFSSLHLAETSQLLGEIGYKNNSLIQDFFKKLNYLIDERKTGAVPDQNFTFQDAVYGGHSNQVARHYIFQGFQDSKEFNEYLTILLNWEGQQKQSPQIQEQKDQEAQQLESSMAEVIDAAVQVKELQKDYQASIASLRQQYYKMLEASDKYQFIMENPYIKYDLLELQEKLVEGGYLEPEEALHGSNETVDQRMDRAANVFYDYVLNYQPELLSPQHESFAQISESKKQEKTQETAEETQNIINLGTLSQTLVGISKQVLSYRRDVEGKDYLNEFYEQYLMPLEKQQAQFEFLKNQQYDTVMMEREYLKAWKIFKNESSKLIPIIEEFIDSDKNDINGQLQALNALSMCRVEASDSRQKIIQNIQQKLKDGSQSLNTQAIIDGLLGMGHSTQISNNMKELSRQLIDKVNPNNLTFNQLVDSLWSMSLIGEYNSKTLGDLLNQLNQLNFERLDHDLSYDQFLKITDIYNAFQIEAPSDMKVTNKALEMAVKSKEEFLKGRYKEHETHYDPFKNRVVQGISKGLTEASIHHQTIIEDQLYQNKQQEIENLNQNQYPYKPDLIMGHKGQKVGVFVFPERYINQDTKNSNGVANFKMRLVEKANKEQIKSASIGINKVIDYDIEDLKIQFNGNFNFQQEIENQVKGIKDLKQIDDRDLVQFSTAMLKQAEDFIDTLTQTKDFQQMDQFVKMIYHIFHTKQTNQLKFDPNQVNAGNDELKFQLMKLNLLYENLSPNCKEFVSQFIPSGATSFKSILQNVKNSLTQQQVEKQADANISQSWKGTRLEAELPVSQEYNFKKSIVPEIINQKFMWVDDYFHYEDWKQKLQQTFDHFNLLIIPQSNQEMKFFFDKQNRKRCIPQGVFPFPNQKRKLIEPVLNSFQKSIIENPDHDQFTLFEKEPYKMMVLKELKKSEKLAPINEEVSMITNLQNIKQGLKADYSDKEVLNILLLNLNFTDQLIEQHLKSDKQKQQQPIFLPRDSEKYRQFIEKTYQSKDKEDPYTQFFLKEAAKKERIVKTYEESKELENQDDIARSQDELNRSKQKQESLQKKVDDMLLVNEMENEDFYNLSHALKSNVNISYNLKSLIKSDFVYDVDPDLQDQSLTSEQFLNIQRRRAETKLIKMKIIYKIYEQGIQTLSVNEKQYLKNWVKDLTENKSRNIQNIRDSMLQDNPTTLNIGDLDAKNIYTINSIPRVQIDRNKHSQFALNDLVLEMSHFLDEEVVNKVETEIFSERVKQEWQLSKDFKIIETRNKEISLVLNELEEVAWRMAGMFDSDDYQNVKRMISIDRNMDSIDKEYYENDMKSLQNFINQINPYDERIKLLDQWLVRKEDEYKSRINKPPAHMKKTDQELHEQIEKPIRDARQRLLSKFLVADEYGNKIEKEYKDLTSQELHTLSESLAVRLYLFNYDYPSFLPQAIKAIMEHPNLQRSDQDMLSSYCRIFEVDWKGQKEALLNGEYMSTHPIALEGTNLNSYGSVDNERVQEMIRRACAEYVPQVTSQILNFK